MNTAQSRARAAALDQVAPPPSTLVAPAATARRAGPDPAETPEVEVVPVAGSRLGRSRATVLVLSLIHI